MVKAHSAEEARQKIFADLDFDPGCYDDETLRAI
jgi:hypothetical protein